MKTKNYYGIYENDGYKFEDYKITLVETRYEKTVSGKSWKKKPTSEEIKEIKFENYFNYISSIDFFKNLGGYERVEKNYTIVGYIVTQITSISPNKEIKKVYQFKFERK